MPPPETTSRPSFVAPVGDVVLTLSSADVSNLRNALGVFEELLARVQGAPAPKAFARGVLDQFLSDFQTVAASPAATVQITNNERPVPHAARVARRSRRAASSTRLNEDKLAETPHGEQKTSDGGGGEGRASAPPLSPFRTPAPTLLDDPEEDLDDLDEESPSPDRAKKTIDAIRSADIDEPLPIRVTAAGRRVLDDVDDEELEEQLDEERGEASTVDDEHLEGEEGDPDDADADVEDKPIPPTEHERDGAYHLSRAVAPLPKRTAKATKDEDLELHVEDRVGRIVGTYYDLGDAMRALGKGKGRGANDEAYLVRNAKTRTVVASNEVLPEWKRQQQAATGTA